MTKNKFIRVLIAFFLIINSCEYEPNDVYIRKTIENPETPLVYSVNLDLDSDTFYTGQTNLFMYDFVSNKNINAVRFILDDKEQLVSDRVCAAFNFKDVVLNYGLHTLTVEIFIGSGTESIADIIGVEGYLFTKTWILKVDSKYHSQVYTKIENGYLKIIWPQYTAPDFEEYEVYRYRDHLIASIKNQTITETIDSSYIGEGAEYDIKVVRNESGLGGWGSVNLGSDLPSTTYTADEDNQYYFIWEKSKYYNAIDAYQVIQDPNYSDEKIVKSTNNPNDTSYHITSHLFGESIYLNLRIIPKRNITNNNGTPYYQIKHVYTILGYPFKTIFTNNIEGFSQVSRHEFVFVENQDTIYRYSTELKKVVDKQKVKLCGGFYDVNFTTSPLRKNITTFHDCENILLLSNPGNLNISTKYNISTVAPFNTTPVISDNNIIVTTHVYNLYVYDLNSKEKLLTYTSNSGHTPTCYSISSNGNYLFVKEDSFRLIKCIQSGFQTVWSYPGGFYDPIKYIKFHATNPDQLAYWDGQTFYIKNCSDFSTVYEFALTDQAIFDVDYFNAKMLCFNDGKLVVRNLLDGELMQEISVNFNNYSDNCYLIDNVIANQRGVLYFLK